MLGAELDSNSRHNSFMQLGAEKKVIWGNSPTVNGLCLDLTSVSGGQLNNILNSLGLYGLLLGVGLWWLRAFCTGTNQSGPVRGAPALGPNRACIHTTANGPRTQTQRYHVRRGTWRIIIPVNLKRSSSGSCMRCRYRCTDFTRNVISDPLHSRIILTFTQYFNRFET